MIFSGTMPRETPQLAGFQIACAWQPAKAVSGDYFDVILIRDGNTLVADARAEKGRAARAV